MFEISSLVEQIWYNGLCRSYEIEKKKGIFISLKGLFFTRFKYVKNVVLSFSQKLIFSMMLNAAQLFIVIPSKYSINM